MTDLKPVIAKNITELRRSAGMTQIELAGKLNYSDKAVSKWEHGDSTPDINILADIASVFGVSVDYLLTEVHEPESDPQEKKDQVRHYQKMVTLICCAMVWLIATIVYVILRITVGAPFPSWMAFIYALPVTCIVYLVFNSIWGNRFNNYYIISALLWSVLLSIFFTLLKYNLWLWYTTCNQCVKNIKTNHIMSHDSLFNFII